MTNQKLLDKIEATWIAFLASFEGLTPAQMEQPGAAGDWSVKDILAHVTTWEAESLTHLPVIAAGEKTRAIAGCMAASTRSTRKWLRQTRLPLDEVLRQLETTHRQLVDYVATAPDGQFGSKTRCARLGWDSHKHYPHHEQAIREWRAQAGI